MRKTNAVTYEEVLQPTQKNVPYTAARVEEGKTELHQRLTVKHKGTKSYFAEYHTSKQEACDLICKELGIV